MLKDITPLLLTYNEQDNIDRCVSRLRWAGEVIIVDSFSTDRTETINTKYSNISLLKRAFDTHASQWNFGLTCVNTDWVLSLDADYIISDEFCAEVDQLDLCDGKVAYWAHFVHCVFGKPVRGALYPKRIVLFDKRFCTYVDDGHTQVLDPNGPVGRLRSYILHDDRKDVTRFLWSQVRYSDLEAKKLCSRKFTELDKADAIRKLIFLMPFVIAPYCLLVKGGILSGWRGLFYAFQRVVYELILSLKLIELRVVGHCRQMEQTTPDTADPRSANKGSK